MFVALSPEYILYLATYSVGDLRSYDKIIVLWDSVSQLFLRGKTPWNNVSFPEQLKQREHKKRGRRQGAGFTPVV